MGEKSWLDGEHEYETNAVTGEEKRMNYPAFMKKVEEYANQGDAEELRVFIHNLAREVKQSDRDDFLMLLSDCCNVLPERKKEKYSNHGDSLENRVDNVMARLREIIDGEVELDSEYNEEYDDWNDSEDDEFVFSDPEGLLEDIESAFELLHECLDHEIYIKGAELAEILSEVKVQVGGDYSDYGENALSIYEIDCQNLLKEDYATGVREAAYLTCIGNKENQRAAALLRVINNFQTTSISLEDILQTGKEEIDLESFLPSWIAEVAKLRSAYAERLLLEAQMMLMDEQKELQIASQYAESHPMLYDNYLKTKQEDHSFEELKVIGMKALDEIPCEKKERAEIALLTAGYALKCEDRKCAESCWAEAFRTAPTAVNYLRLRLLSDQWENQSIKLREEYEAYYEHLSEWERKPLAELYFFEGRFDDLLNGFMKTDKGIGWSSTFMKEGIALMLLFLARDHKSSGVGLKEMIRRAIEACDFSTENFCKGTNIEKKENSTELFQEMFDQWREHIEITEAEQEEWLKRVGAWLSLRVEAIMNANRRNYYGECAAFVAALGEVKESRGRIGAKADIMEDYRMNYSRRRAFHDELRKYGMKR